MGQESREQWGSGPRVLLSNALESSCRRHVSAFTCVRSCWFTPEAGSQVPRANVVFRVGRGAWDHLLPISPDKPKMNYQGQRKIEKTGREGVVGEEET